MRKVNTITPVVKEYSEKEIVHFLAGQLTRLDKVSAAPGQEAYVLGEIKMWVHEISELASALDQKMNGKDAAIVV